MGAGPGACYRLPMKTALAALAGLLIASATTASAAPATDPVTRDARCLLVMGAMGTDANSKTAALLGVFYYAGRISARDPGFDFSTRLRAVAEQIGDADFEGEAKRCGAEMTQASKSLDAAQASLTGVKPKP